MTISMDGPKNTLEPAPPTVAPSEDWPVDVQRMDETGEVDLGQLDFNLSLTPAERIAQNDRWVEFIHIARRAGQRLHGEEPSA